MKFLKYVFLPTMIIQSIAFASAAKDLTAVPAESLNIVTVPDEIANFWLFRTQLLNPLSLTGVSECVSNFTAREDELTGIACGNALASIARAEAGLQRLSTVLVPKLKKAMESVQRSNQVVFDLRKVALTVTNGESSIRMHNFIDQLESRAQSVDKSIRAIGLNADVAKDIINDMQKRAADLKAHVQKLPQTSVQQRADFFQHLEKQSADWYIDLATLGGIFNWVQLVSDNIEYVNVAKHARFVGDISCYEQQLNTVYVSTSDVQSVKVLFAGESGQSNQLTIVCRKQSELFFPATRLQPVQYDSAQNLILAPQNLGAGLRQDWRSVIAPAQGF